MNPVKLSQQLQDTLISYLSTTFDVNRDGQEPALALFVEESFSRPQSLFAGPYLELTPPYKTAESMSMLADEGTLSPALLDMKCFQEGRPIPIDVPLYTHQVKAFRKLCVENRNIVVSSGTGSGKTECFLIPILNDLLLDPSPGVRAVIVYPLNALVNDQLDRLRILLRGTNITFGRYTSELDTKADRARRQMEKDWRNMEPARKAMFDQYPLPNEIIGRDQIQEHGQLPQILITNYAMLEYLLLRPQDHPLFAAGKWRFAILDEAHTYAGAQGIEVGLLMRRLKLRLGHEPGQMRCIATSATLTDDDAEDASRFAAALFGESFDADDIIFGELDHNYVPTKEQDPIPASVYLHPRFDDLIENVRSEQWQDTEEMALLMHEIGLIDDAALTLAEDVEPARFLWEVLRGNRDLQSLREIMIDSGRPLEVGAVAEQLFHASLSPNERELALYHLIELAAMARPGIEKPSLLPARYHLFVRPPQGIWACINPTCPDRQHGNHWSKLFASPRTSCDACNAPVFPLVVCRTCGQVYLKMQKVNEQYLAEAAMGEEPTTRYMTWRPILENRALATEDDEDDEDVVIDSTGAGTLRQNEIKLCLQCNCAVNSNGKCDCPSTSKSSVTLYLLFEEQKRKNSDAVRKKDVTHMHECGRCHSVALKGTEIATEITLNALTPLAVLTEDLYRSLPESSSPDIKNKPGGGRKLLSFYDSRQGAARFAAFVQDIVNRQAYRRIIAEAVNLGAQNSYWPDLERMSELCLGLALDYRVIHNDPELDGMNLPRNEQYLNQSQRGRILRYLRKQVFAEITTQLRSRQSLESLGLLSIQYFEPTRLPDFGILAGKLKLTVAETRALVEYLLDDLRRAKVVTLPEGVLRDDPIFGRNAFSPRIVRQEAGMNEVAWIGVTPRHRRRQLMQKVLRQKGLPSDENATISALDAVLDWMIDFTDILDTSRPAEGYQLRHDRLYFQADGDWYRCDQCQRLNDRGQALPCPYPHCQGTYQPVDISDLQEKSFYYYGPARSLVPMRIEEHTAQLDTEKGRDYQNQFKAGDINMLSCSTTFEMGIDLGDLQAVVMSNIPPTVANYKQRAGRAGRRTSGTAFILAWASDRPHDQTYFRTPSEIIGGSVRVPFLDVENAIILQRHVNAVVLSEFLRYCATQQSYDRTIAAFFDGQSTVAPYYPQLDDWMNERTEDLSNLLERYVESVTGNFSATESLHLFRQSLRVQGYEHYASVSGYYKRIRQELLEHQLELVQRNAPSNEVDPISGEFQRFGRLLERLQREDLINYLSDRGVLPSYSFPLHVVELRIPPYMNGAKDLRLQRNLQLAIQEYAPGQEVVADKRIWKSDGLDLFGKEPQVFAYHICPTCNHLTLVDTPGKAIPSSVDPCPVCQTPLPRRGRTEHRYIQPDGFRVSSDSGRPAGQYVDRPFNLMRSALVPRRVDAELVSPVLSLGYDRSGALLYVNEGVYGRGFNICPVCGRSLAPNARSCSGKHRGQPCPGKVDRSATHALGFRRETDTLHFRFSSADYIVLPEAGNDSFWLSLMYALLHGASRALQIERRDIDAVLFPESSGQNWKQSIVIFDNVPGGAGHVKRIQNEIRQVVAAALEIVSCDCEKSCYRCLREYSNQWEHTQLDRVPVVRFLKALDADLQRSLLGEVTGLQPVPAVNPMAWLWEQLQQAHDEVVLYADQVTLTGPVSGGDTWLDLLQQLLQRGVAVRLFINQLPDQLSGDPEAVALATHLRLLLRKRLDLRLTNRQLPWLAVLDPNGGSPSAVRTQDGEPIVLSDMIDQGLLSTSHSDTVKQALESMKSSGGQVIDPSRLKEPSTTQVVEVEQDNAKHDELEYFAEFYAKPVVGMVVNDRYLDNRTKILDRLGTHISLAKRGGALKWVEVNTGRGPIENGVVGLLKDQHPDVKIKFKQNSAEHDRYIEIRRADGTRHRVIIGVGLDFIQPDGYVRKTFLIFHPIS